MGRGAGLGCGQQGWPRLHRGGPLLSSGFTSDHQDHHSLAAYGQGTRSHLARALPGSREKSGCSALSASVPARELGMLGRRDEGVMAEPQRVKAKHSLWPSFWGILTQKSSPQCKGPPTMGTVEWEGPGVSLQSSSPNASAPGNKLRQQHQEHKPSTREYEFSNEVSGCCMVVPSPGLCGDQAALAGRPSCPRHLQGSAVGTHLSG